MLNDIFSLYKTKFKNNEENDFISEILKSAKSSQNFEIIPKFREEKKEFYFYNIPLITEKEEKISKLK